ncbi:MAG TPA: MarC family protein [Gaiellaceae bacterium]|jgi:multiple antibiotic resistance protein|nr:MarC family protein [Gaiellaceae bacterium]
MNWRAFGETFVTLFVITDPIGNAPIFVSITRKLTPRQRQSAAIRAVGAAGALIIGFAVFGELILRYLHVSLGSLSIAGGLLLGLVSLEMLRGHDFPGGDPDAPENVALVPLATPLVAGPGAIATSIVLWRQHPGLEGHGAVLLAIVLAVGCVGVALLLAERLTRAMNAAVLSFLTRVFGLLLSAIAVQLVVDGVRSLT